MSMSLMPAVASSSSWLASLPPSSPPATLPKPPANSPTERRLRLSWGVSRLTSTELSLRSPPGMSSMLIPYVEFRSSLFVRYFVNAADEPPCARL
uniref:Uncharacterized protein n=1 Tax=Ixodes ricinus TaxID=34613 RepID=A0A6B0UHN1_IXORI